MFLAVASAPPAGETPSYAEWVREANEPRVAEVVRELTVRGTVECAFKAQNDGVRCRDSKYSSHLRMWCSRCLNDELINALLSAPAGETARERIAKLIAEWRVAIDESERRCATGSFSENRHNIGIGERCTLRRCADELEAALRADASEQTK